MHLSDIEEGSSVIIVKVKGRGAFRRRIMEMGFVQGKEVRVVKRAPLMDPIEYAIMGYLVSLRIAEASQIEVVTTDLLEHYNLDFNGTLIEDSNLKTRTNLLKNINVALIGNPNCGKTTLFNQVSGMHEHVGNYSGVTVGAKLAEFKHGEYLITIVDLPGTYSLTTLTPEELYVRNYIFDEMPDVVINVVDASALERNLYLTTQLIDLDIRLVMALNMSDELEKRHDKLDDKTFSAMLGVPLVRTSGVKKMGIKELFDVAVDVFEDRNPVERHIHINYGNVLEKGIKNLQTEIRKPENSDLTDRISSRFLAIKVLEGDTDALSKIEKCSNFHRINELRTIEKSNLYRDLNESPEAAFTNAKYGFIHGALKETFRAGNRIDRRDFTKAIDSFMTDRIYGFPLFIFFMWIMFQATFFIGSYPQQWIDQGVGLFSHFLSHNLPEGILRDLIVDGIVGGVGSVISFLPNILILFFFISLMEDTGYMARVAFIVDKLMHKVGLHGRSFIPLLMGFGCNVPAIMATRTIEGRNDRLVTMLINPFMSCSARLPVYVLIISAFFPDHPGSMLFLIYTLGIAMAAIMALIFKKTLLKAKEFPFVMELPPYRTPTAFSIVKHMWFKAMMYLKKMGGIILVASLIMWTVTYFPMAKSSEKDLKAKVELHFKSVENTGLSQDSILILKSSMEQSLISEMRSSQQENSYMGRIGKAIEPTIAPLGFDWKIGVSLISGMAAKEIVISTMGVLYQFDTGLRDEQLSLKKKLQETTYTSGPKKGQLIYTPLVAFSFLIFVLFYFPCLATIAAIRRESGSWKWAIFSATYTTALAYLASLLVFQLGSLLGF